MSDQKPGKSENRKVFQDGSVLPTSQVKVPMPKVSPPKPAKAGK